MHLGICAAPGCDQPRFRYEYCEAHHAVPGDDLPPKPSITEAGNYDKAELLSYIGECRRRRIPLHRMAEHLRVSRDRIEYVTGAGFDLVFRGVA